MWDYNGGSAMHYTSYRASNINRRLDRFDKRASIYILYSEREREKIGKTRKIEKIFIPIYNSAVDTYDVFSDRNLFRNMWLILK